MELAHLFIRQYSQFLKNENNYASARSAPLLKPYLILSLMYPTTTPTLT